MFYSSEELDRYCNRSEADDCAEDLNQQEHSGKYVELTEERVEFLVNMMRDINTYVESKDFELGLPITNFARYHELWSMQFAGDDD